jgi:hypothetical protein
MFIITFLEFVLFGFPLLFLSGSQTFSLNEGGLPRGREATGVESRPSTRPARDDTAADVDNSL